MNLGVLAGASLLMQGSRLGAAIYPTKSPKYLFGARRGGYKIGLEALLRAKIRADGPLENKFPAKSVAGCAGTAA
jgi:hypothetical protein